MSSRECTPRDSLPRHHSRKARNESRSRRDIHTRNRNKYRETRSRSTSSRSNRSESIERSRRRRDSSFGRRYSPRHDPLNKILDRLNALEARLPSKAIQTSTLMSLHPSTPSTPITTSTTASAAAAGVEASADASRETNAADRIVDALSSMIQVRSKHYYISNFDPSVHDFDVWCAEVDQGRELNHWDDRECLGRIGSCLRGDAKTWLNDWVTNDRSWTNFKVEFRSLCPREVDIATVLYEVMGTTSHKFTTYAEYARRSLLRLNIVKGLSDELKTAIVVRGISDPQVKAATANAKLQSKDLVEFLSAYLKPKAVLSNMHSSNPVRTANFSNNFDRKRKSTVQYDRLACFTCGNVGHKQNQCPKRSRRTETNAVNPHPRTEPNHSQAINSVSKSSKTCTFCKKSGHSVDTCFVKERVESKSNKNVAGNVNFCSEFHLDKTI